MISLHRSSPLLRWKKQIENVLEKECSQDTDLDRAITYALTSSGKRLRPLLVHMVADGLGNNLDVMQAALATEYFHTASLIADDLPCMDDDDYRRGKLSLHRKFGEGTALLASYGLIAEAFGKIEKNGHAMKHSGGPFALHADEACSIGLKCASRCAGMKGATLGHFFDLYRKQDRLREIEEVIYLKTITLFEGAFVLGWVFGGGDLSRVGEIERLSRHFGLAFQIRDDILDIPQDREREAHANYALAMGPQQAVDRFHEEMKIFFDRLEKVNIHKDLFVDVYQMLEKEVKVT